MGSTHNDIWDDGLLGDGPASWLNFLHAVIAVQSSLQDADHSGSVLRSESYNLRVHATL